MSKEISDFDRFMAGDMSVMYRSQNAYAEALEEGSYSSLENDPFAGMENIMTPSERIAYKEMKERKRKQNQEYDNLTKSWADELRKQ